MSNPLFELFMAELRKLGISDEIHYGYDLPWWDEPTRQKIEAGEFPISAWIALYNFNRFWAVEFGNNEYLAFLTDGSNWTKKDRALGLTHKDRDVREIAIRALGKKVAA